nr:MAG TPA: hypothetical protein [Caudoviricetes sp.]
MQYFEISDSDSEATIPIKTKGKSSGARARMQQKRNPQGVTTERVICYLKNEFRHENCTRFSGGSVYGRRTSFLNCASCLWNCLRIVCLGCCYGGLCNREGSHGRANGL